MDGRQHPEFLHARETGQGFAFLQHQFQFIQNAPARQFVHKAQLQRVADQTIALRADAETVALLKTYRPQGAGRVLHKAQGMEHADAFSAYIVLSVEKIHQQAEGPFVEMHGHSVDGKIAAVQIHFDG